MERVKVDRTEWTGQGEDNLASNEHNWSDGVPCYNEEAFIPDGADIFWDLDSIAIDAVIEGMITLSVSDSCKAGNGTFYVPDAIKQHINMQTADRPPPNENPDVSGILEWNKQHRTDKEILENFNITIQQYGQILDEQDAARTWGAGSGGGSDGLYSTAINWTGDTLPGAGDALTYDVTQVGNCSIDADTAALASLTIAATYTGTITVGINQTGTKGVFTTSKGIYNTNGYNDYYTSITLNANATLTWGASKIYISGGFTTTGGTLNYNTSVLTFTANQNVSAVSTTVPYDVVVNDNVIIKLLAIFYICHSLTIVGTNGGGFTGAGLYPGIGWNGTTRTATAAQAFTCGVNATFAGSGGLLIASKGDFSFDGCANFTILYITSDNTTTNVTATLTTRGITCSELNTYTIAGAGVGDLNTGDFAVSATTLNLHLASTYPGAMTCGNSTITCTTFTTGGMATNFIIFNTSTWNVSGNWTNTSTSASWNAGTATINANGTAAQVLGLNNGNSANITYYNFTISNAGNVTVTLGANTLAITGLFNISRTTGTVTAATNNPTLNISAGFTIASGAVYTKGSGTTTFNGTGNVGDSNATPNDCGTVTTSGSVTLTQTAGVTTSGFTVAANGVWTTSAGNYALVCTGITLNGTLTGNASAISVGASGWSNPNTTAKFTYGTSTVTFTATCSAGSNYSSQNYATNSEFYNMVINTGVTITLTYAFVVQSNLTLNGTGGWGAASAVCFSTTNANANPLTVSGTESITNCRLQFYVQGVAGYNVPAISIANLYIVAQGSGTSPIATLTGNLAVSGTIYITNDSTGTATPSINTGNFSITGGAIRLGDYGTTRGFLTCGASAISVTSFTTVGTLCYVVFNTSSWTITGNWTCTTMSASWNAGTSTINFNGTGAQALALNNGASANIQYFNITIGNSSAATVTLGANNIRVNGLLNISSATCTVSETVNNPTWSIYGGITKANGSTWTRGTGLITVYDTCTLTDNGAVKTDLINLTVNAAGKTITLANATFNYTGTFRIQAGTVTTNNLVLPGVTVNNGSWNKTPGPVNTITMGTLQIDLGAVLNSKKSPPIVNGVAAYASVNGVPAASIATVWGVT